jgi:hypothetical protein
MSEVISLDAVHRGRAERIEVEVLEGGKVKAMIEFNIVPGGLIEGDLFGPEMGVLTSDIRHQAFKLAQGWLTEARENNPAI